MESEGKEMIEPTYVPLNFCDSCDFCSRTKFFSRAKSEDNNSSSKHNHNNSKHWSSKESYSSSFDSQVGNLFLRSQMLKCYTVWRNRENCSKLYKKGEKYYTLDLKILYQNMNSWICTKIVCLLKRLKRTFYTNWATQF